MAIFLLILLFAGFVSVKRLAGIEKSLFGGQFALIVVLFVGLCFDNKWVNIPLTVLIAALTFAGAFFWMADFKYLAHKFDDPEDNTPTPRQILVCPRMVAIAMVASYLSAGIVWLTEFGTMWSWISWILVVLAVVLFACAIRWAWEQNVWNKNHSAASGKELVSSVIWAILVAILICVSAIKVRAQLRNPFDFGEKRVTIGVVNPTPTPAPAISGVPAPPTSTPTPTPPAKTVEEIVNSYSDQQLLDIFGEPRPFNTKSTYPRWNERAAATGLIDAVTFATVDDVECLDVVNETLTNDIYAADAAEAFIEVDLLGESQWIKDFQAEYMSGKKDWVESGLEVVDGVRIHTMERHLTLCRIAIAELALQEIGYFEPNQLTVQVHWGLVPELEQPVRLTTCDEYPFYVYRAMWKDGRMVYFGINARDYRWAIITLIGDPTPTPTPKDTPTPTPPKDNTPTPSPTPSNTPSPTPTPPKDNTPTPSPTPTPSNTPTPTPSNTPTPSPSPTPSPTPTNTPTPTPTPTPKKDPGQRPIEGPGGGGVVGTPTPSPKPEATPTPSPTPQPRPPRIAN